MTPFFKVVKIRLLIFADDALIVDGVALRWSAAKENGDPDIPVDPVGRPAPVATRL